MMFWLYVSGMVFLGGIFAADLYFCGLRPRVQRPAATLPQQRATDRLHRLQQIRAKGGWHREQLEALVHECCDVLGVDDDNDSYQRNLCEEVVYCNRDPLTVIRTLEETQ